MVTIDTPAAKQLQSGKGNTKADDSNERNIKSQFGVSERKRLLSGIIETDHVVDHLFLDLWQPYLHLK